MASLLGSDALGRLRQNPNATLPYADDLTTDDEWLNRALQTLLTLDDIQAVAHRLGGLAATYQQPLQKEIEGLRRELDARDQALGLARQQVQTAEAGRERAEIDLFRLRKEMATMLPARPVIEMLFQQAGEEGIRELLLEAADHPSPDLGAFLAAFAPAWNQLRAVPAGFSDQATDNLRSLHAALTRFLTALTGQYLPQRRPLLDKVAQWASALFSDYLFVSPEESVQVDPAIHNAHGIGGSTVVEGRSFAVLRRPARTVMLYADILAK